MFRKFLVGLPPVLAVAALVAVPAVSQAAPQFFMNGQKDTTKHMPAISMGKITLKNNGVFPNVECETFLSEQLGNEVKEGTERGFEETTGFGTWECKSGVRCEVTNERGVKKEGVFLSAEGPPELKTEKAHRTGNTSLPWLGELTEKEPSAGVRERYVLTHHVKLWEVWPPEMGPNTHQCGGLSGYEIPFEDREGASEKASGDELEPEWVNGAKNGMSPSHIKFEGEKTEGTEKTQGPPETGRLESEVGAGIITGSLVSTGSTAFELILAK